MIIFPSALYQEALNGVPLAVRLIRDVQKWTAASLNWLLVCDRLAVSRSTRPCLTRIVSDDVEKSSQGA